MTLQKRLRATFRLEAEELLAAISSGLIALEKDPAGPGHLDRIEAVFRQAHSLKGAARTVNLGELESVCQAMEEVFAAWKRDGAGRDPSLYDGLHSALDLMAGCLPGVQGEEAPSAGSRLEEVAAAIRVSPGARADDAARSPQAPAAGGAERSVFPAPKSAEEGIPVTEAARNPAASDAGSARATPPPGPGARPGERPAAAQMVRLPAAKLDRLLIEVEEMVGVKQSVAGRAEELTELMAEMDHWMNEVLRVRPRLGNGIASGGTDRRGDRGAGDGRPAPELLEGFLDMNYRRLERMAGRLRALRKAALRDEAAVERKVDDLLEGAKRLLMLPLATLFDLLPKLVRDLSRDQGVTMDLVVGGGEIELDKRILETIKDPLIHMVRNGVAHGVETPEARARNGKPARAVLKVAATRVNAGEVEILVADDGAGIDPERVKAAAVECGRLSHEQAARLSPRDALDLIFQSEVSTSPVVTRLSGRGLGLAIVRECAEKLGGRVTVESEAGRGAAFRVLLPTVLATFRGVLARVGERLFVLPAASMERVVRVRTADLQTVGSREAIRLEGEVLSLAWMDAVLGMKDAGTARAGADLLTVAVLAVGGERLAVVVDAVLGEQEVLVKALAKPLLRLRNVAGATILASGQVVPVLHVGDLMKSARRTGGAPAPRGADSTPRAPSPAPRRILVVEDSITSRLLLKSILESAGFEVRTAVDGVEALGALRGGGFDLAVSDVEMPRMNGFELAASIRADNRLGSLPLILVTARGSREDRERGVEVGADAYIVKSGFDQGNLLETIRRLIG